MKLKIKSHLNGKRRSSFIRVFTYLENCLSYYKRRCI